MSLRYNIKLWWHGIKNKHKVDFFVGVCKDCSFGKAGLVKFDLEEHLKEKKNRPKWKKILDHAYWWIRYGFWQKIEALPREHRWDCQRIKRGYSDRDVWGFDYFLADIIAKGIRDLQKQAHGYPPGLYANGNPHVMQVNTEEDPEDDKAFQEWKIILGKIAKTFETAQKIQEYGLCYTSSEEYTDEWYKESMEFCERMNSRDVDYHYRAMTLEEIKEYEEGWDLMRQYFFNLWD